MCARQEVRNVSFFGNICVRTKRMVAIHILRTFSLGSDFWTPWTSCLDPSYVTREIKRKPVILMSNSIVPTHMQMEKTCNLWTRK